MFYYLKNYKVSSPIIFVILFIIGYLMWNNFEMPVIFIGETEQIQGKIYDISIGYGIRGVGYVQNVKFVYSFDDKNYIGVKQVDKKLGRQLKGNSVIVEVSKRNMQYYKVQMFKRINSKNIFPKTKYLKSEKSKYEEIVIENGVFNYTIYQNKSVEKYSLTGLTNTVNDTIIVECFYEKKLSEKDKIIERILEKNEKTLMFIEKDNVLINLSTDSKYKVLSKKRTKHIKTELYN